MKMNNLSKLAVLTQSGRVQGQNLLRTSTQVLNTSRHSSEDVNYLTRTDPSSLKRGRGGRSSFSGVVATIFGATGFLGQILCNRLGKCGTQLIIPYRGDHYDVQPLKLMGDLGQILFLPYHLCDEDSIRKAVKHSSVVINLVGRDWDTRNFTLHQTNFEGARRIARISKEMGVEKFIHMSALNSNIEHEGYLLPGGSKFLKAKAQSEEAVREYFPNAVIFRPSDVWGQQDRFFAYYLRYYRYTGTYLALPYAGNGIWKQPVFSGDVCQGIANAVYDQSALGNTYEAVGPRRYELSELIDWLHRVARRTPELWGYKRFDMKWDPTLEMRARLNDFNPSFPVAYFVRDKIEREAISDTPCDVPNELPNLQDLGVTLTKMEDRINYELKAFRAFGYVQESIGLFEKPKPAPFIEAS